MREIRTSGSVGGLGRQRPGPTRPGYIQKDALRACRLKPVSVLISTVALERIRRRSCSPRSNRVRLRTYPDSDESDSGARSSNGGK